MKKRGLILVDIQNDYFPGGLWEVEGMTAAATQAVVLLTDARRRGDMVIHVRHEAASAAAPFFRPGSEGADIAAVVAPGKGEAVILKHRPNSFLNTGLLDQLRGAAIDEVTIVGAMSQMCIDATARAAADYGFGVTVITDACAARQMQLGDVVVPAAQVHAAFMAALSPAYGRVISTADYLADEVAAGEGVAG